MDEGRWDEEATKGLREETSHVPLEEGHADVKTSKGLRKKTKHRHDPPR